MAPMTIITQAILSLIQLNSFIMRSVSWFFVISTGLGDTLVRSFKQFYYAFRGGQPSRVKSGQYERNNFTCFYFTCFYFVQGGHIPALRHYRLYHLRDHKSKCAAHVGCQRGVRTHRLYFRRSRTVLLPGVTVTRCTFFHSRFSRAAQIRMLFR